MTGSARPSRNERRAERNFYKSAVTGISQSEIFSDENGFNSFGNFVRGAVRAGVHKTGNWNPLACQRPEEADAHGRLAIVADNLGLSAPAPKSTGVMRAIAPYMVPLVAAGIGGMAIGLGAQDMGKIQSFGNPDAAFGYMAQHPTAPAIIKGSGQSWNDFIGQLRSGYDSSSNEIRTFVKRLSDKDMERILQTFNADYSRGFDLSNIFRDGELDSTESIIIPCMRGPQNLAAYTKAHLREVYDQIEKMGGRVDGISDRVDRQNAVLDSLKELAKRGRITPYVPKTFEDPLILGKEIPPVKEGLVDATRAFEGMYHNTEKRRNDLEVLRGRLANSEARGQHLEDLRAEYRQMLAETRSQEFANYARLQGYIAQVESALDEAKNSPPGARDRRLEGELKRSLKGGKPSLPPSFASATDPAESAMSLYRLRKVWDQSYERFWGEELDPKNDEFSIGIMGKRFATSYPWTNLQLIANSGELSAGYMRNLGAGLYVETEAGLLVPAEPNVSYKVSGWNADLGISKSEDGLIAGALLSAGNVITEDMGIKIRNMSLKAGGKLGWGHVPRMHGKTGFQIPVTALYKLGTKDQEAGGFEVMLNPSVGFGKLRGYGPDQDQKPVYVFGMGPIVKFDRSIFPGGDKADMLSFGGDVYLNLGKGFGINVRYLQDEISAAGGFRQTNRIVHGGTELRF
jgi:hypothetical protein